VPSGRVKLAHTVGEVVSPFPRQLAGRVDDKLKCWNDSTSWMTPQNIFKGYPKQLLLFYQLIFLASYCFYNTSFNEFANDKWLEHSAAISFGKRTHAMQFGTQQCKNDLVNSRLPASLTETSLTFQHITQ
jgi:hypothetical protein